MDNPNIPLDLIPVDLDDGSPYLFHLPRDQAAIRTLSALRALKIVYEYTQRKQSDVLLPDRIEVAAKVSCDACLQEARLGRQGCNAPDVFRRLYAETFVPVYTWAYYAFTHDIYVLASDLPEQEQADILTRWAVELLTPRHST